MVEPANQELASTATPKPIHNNNTDIIKIDESVHRYKNGTLFVVLVVNNSRTYKLKDWNEML